MKTLAKAKLIEAIEVLAQKAKVLVPAKIAGISKFTPWDSTLTPDFAAVKTLLPPKDSLFPHTEKMYSYQVANQDITELTVHNEAEPQIIFGIRPCDMQSIVCMDDVFLTKSFVDDFYKSKRDKLVTVCIGCTNTAQTCFCQSMGLEPAGHAAADIQLNDLGDHYRVTAQTPAGEAVLQEWQGLLVEADEQAVPPVDCSLQVDAKALPGKLAAMFAHPIWQEVSRKCIGCGTCTYLCPTCYCFDMNVAHNGSEGYRFRCWDSCMFSDYARMAGGHDPRPSKTERIRNRFLHKLEYFNERYGKNLCVGCGRCLEKCPVNVDITVFIDKVGEVAGSESV